MILKSYWFIKSYFSHLQSVDWWSALIQPMAQIQINSTCHSLGGHQFPEAGSSHYGWKKHKKKLVEISYDP